MLYVKKHAIMAGSRTLGFKARRKNPELIPPAEPTPFDFKFLSDVDNQIGLRCHIPMMSFYKKNPSMEGKDPVHVIRDAIAKALVFYYPLAGRLREYSGGKLAVECTGEGVVFVEADADVALEEFGDDLYPPFPNLEELLCIQSFDEITNSPLLSFQVTRLKCGGFILAYIFNHTMCDGVGLVQFLNAVGEIARGGATPSVLPVWERHLLTARAPPARVSLVNEVVPESSSGGGADKIVRSFFISAADISALRRSLPPHLRSCSKFEVLAGCVWRCRTIALSPKPDEKLGFFFVVDFRKRMNPPLPAGYYGNAIVCPAAVTTGHELSKNPLQYAVELVRKATTDASQVRSVEDLMVIRDRTDLMAAAVAEAYVVSDLTHGGFEQADLGWGSAAYGGVAKGIYRASVDVNCYWYIPFKNKKGESGTVVPLCLPLDSMEVFVEQLRMTIAAARRSSAL